MWREWNPAFSNIVLQREFSSQISRVWSSRFILEDFVQRKQTGFFSICNTRTGVIWLKVRQNGQISASIVSCHAECGYILKGENWFSFSNSITVFIKMQRKITCKWCARGQQVIYPWLKLRPFPKQQNSLGCCCSQNDTMHSISVVFVLFVFCVPLQKAAFQDANVCLFVFDCIYFNDVSLMDRWVHHECQSCSVRQAQQSPV